MREVAILLRNNVNAMLALLIHNLFIIFYFFVAGTTPSIEA